MSQLQVTGEAKIRDIQGPVVANSGVITALDGAASQYVRGDGTLADFPTSTGGGSSVSYYLNSSVSQGTIDGNAYRELSKDPIIGTGTDIAISSNGYVANYITDANDPDVVIVPGGNFNCEFYFSVNNNTGSPTTYAELYKYDGSTFTLLGSSSGVPESINQGTTIAPYYFAIPVATATLATTDRLAIRIYVNVDGRTVTLHTENSHLCQVVTTLSKGMVSLNNLTDQSQYLTTGTSGTNFAIASTGDTHTFNLPVASATNTGKLSSTDWSTFNGKVPYTGANNDVDLGLYNLNAQHLFANGLSGINSGNLLIYQGPDFALSSGYTTIYSNGNNIGFVSNPSGSTTYNALFDLSSLSATRTFTLPDLSGTLALLEGAQTFSGAKTFSATTLLNTIYVDGVSYLKHQTTTSYIAGYTTFNAKANGVIEYFFPSSFKSILDFNDAADYTYTFPASSGTLALTSNLAGYLPLTGGTLTGPLYGTFGVFSNFVSAFSISADGSGSTNAGVIQFKPNPSVAWTTGYVAIAAQDLNTLGFYFSGSFSAYFNNSALTNGRTYTLPNANGTLALTSDLGAYLPLTGGTLTGALSGTSATFSSNITATDAVLTKNGDITIKFNPNNVAKWDLYYNNADGTIGFYDRVGSAFRMTLAQTGAATFSSSVTATSESSLFKEGFIVKATTTGGGGSQPAYTYYTAAGSKRWSSFLNVGDDKFHIANASNSEVFTITQGGNVGIGTSSPSALLHLNGANTGYRGQLTIQSTDYAQITFYKGGTTQTDLNASIFSNIGTSEFVIRNNTNAAMIFDTNATERMRITSGGAMYMSRVDSNLTFPDTVGGMYVRTNGNNTGLEEELRIFGRNIGFYSHSGSKYASITSGGNVLIGTTTDLGNNIKLNVNGRTSFNMSGDPGAETINLTTWVSGSAAYGILVQGDAGAYTQRAMRFFHNGSGAAVVGNITFDTTSTAYNTSSDYRLKEDFKQFNGLNVINNIKTYDFAWKLNKNRMYGVVAHELAEVLPYAVVGEKDGKEMQGVDYSKIVPVLIKAIQEQQAQIEELKALIAAK